MKYAIIKCINGAFSIHAEGFTELEKAKVNYHALCQTLWNSEDVLTGKVMLVDEQLNCVEGYAEYIYREAQEEPVEE